MSQLEKFLAQSDGRNKNAVANNMKIKGFVHQQTYFDG